jgi:hypothetical protein
MLDECVGVMEHELVVVGETVRVFVDVKVGEEVGE